MTKIVLDDPLYEEEAICVSTQVKDLACPLWQTISSSDESKVWTGENWEYLRALLSSLTSGREKACGESLEEVTIALLDPQANYLQI